MTIVTLLILLALIMVGVFVVGWMLNRKGGS